MKTVLSLFSFFFLLSFVEAQQVQWANKTIKYSSDLGGKQNGIKRILGKPDAFPQGGASPNAWTPKDALKGYDWVEVSFEKAQTVKQVAVFENLNAGCVVKIGVDTGSGKYETVWTRNVNYKTPTFKASIPADRKYYFRKKRRKIQEAPDVLNPGIEHAVLDNAVSGVVAVRVEFNFALLPGQKQIDAIGISDSDQPLEATINTKPEFENLGSSATISVGDLIPSSIILTQNGQKLFFTDQSQDKEIIYSCSRQNASWTTPIQENKDLNANDEYNFVAASYPDFILKGGMPYARGSGETGYEFLDQHNNSNGLLKITAFANYDETSSATITHDRKLVLMGIETDMTQGGHDLYFTTQKEDGTYGFLQNMGKAVNSAAEEASPFILSDEKTLLFSSNGFSSFGDNDLYMAYRLDDSWKKWSEPINLGSKINSSEYEGSPFYDEENELLYYITLQDGTQVIKSISVPKKLLAH